MALKWIQQRPRTVLLVILLIGLLVRLYMLPISGFSLDLTQFHQWGICALQNQWFGMYVCPTPITHPPINPSFYGLAIGILKIVGADIATFENNGAVIAALKIHLLLFELGIIVLLFQIIRTRVGVLWASAAAAALYWSPGWLVVSAWWGQNDATYSFFMLLAVYLLAQRRVRWSWVALALAWLAKFQSVMFLPVFGILSLRRHGLRSTIEGGLLFALIFGGGTLPFLLGSGKDALTPFTGTVGLFPYITNGAFNMWFWISGSSLTVLPDNQPLIGGLTYAQIGLFLLVIATLLLCYRAWRNQHDDDIYILFAAANLLFFMLPTQIQVRYLYPGLMFLAIAMALAKDWRLVALYIGLSIAFMYNIFNVVWLGIGLLYYPYKLIFAFWTPTLNALLVTGLFVIFLWFCFAPLWRPRQSNA